MISSEGNRILLSWILAGPLALTPFLATPDHFHGAVVLSGAGLAQAGAVNATILSAKQDTTTPKLVVPPGTILPVRPNKSISSQRSEAGETIRAQLMQDVPLPAGKKIPRGSTVYGKIVSFEPAAANGGFEVSLRFDSLHVRHENISLTTNLRAIAGYVDVEQAQIPTLSSGEGEVYAWLPTVQTGGDNVFGRDGTVTRWNDSAQVVGVATPYGVLGHPAPAESGGCRGALYGNGEPQALWVFSADACGVYGLPHVTIAHAGRDAPVGVVVLRFSRKNVHLTRGTGILLRVDEPRQ